MQTISESALVKRINRSLVEHGEMVRVCPFGSRHFDELGRHYVTSTHGRVILAKDVNLTKWARELDLMRPDEVLAD